MTPTILMSGPIRPSVPVVLENIASLRLQFPTSRIFLSTWTESPEVRAAVDFYEACPEPSEDDIRRAVPYVTSGHVNLPDTTAGGRISMYRMIYGVERVCTLARPYLSDSDLIIRIRTDSFFKFEPDYLQELLSTPPAYLAKKGNGSDWFVMSSFELFRRVWLFRDLPEYHQNIVKVSGPELLLEARVPVPITRLDRTRVDMYIAEKDGRKRYYND